MTRNARDQSKIWFMVKMSLGLLLLSLLLPVFVQNAYATNSGQKFQFKDPTYTVAEDAGSVTVHVVRTGGSFDTVASVTYCTCADTAFAIVDFIHSPGTLIFYKGEQEKTITVPIVDDDIYEPTEQFFVELLVTEGNTSLGEIKQTIVTILDNDPKPKDLPPTSAPTSTPTAIPQPPTSSPASQNNESDQLFLAAAATTSPEETPTPTPISTLAPTPTPKAADAVKVLPLKESNRVSALPNTATPLYNYIVVGSLLVLLSGTMLYRRIAAFKRE